jgi:hypothetical protein
MVDVEKIYITQITNTAELGNRIRHNGHGAVIFYQLLCRGLVSPVKRNHGQPDHWRRLSFNVPFVVSIRIRNGKFCATLLCAGSPQPFH